MSQPNVLNTQAPSTEQAAGTIDARQIGSSGVLALTYPNSADATDNNWTLPAGISIRVTDVWLIKLGAGNAGNSVTLRTAAGGAGSAITSALGLNADNSVVRTISLNTNALATFAGGATLFFRQAGAVGGVNNATIYVAYIRV